MALSAFRPRRRSRAQRLASSRRERYKWAEQAIEGVVPADIARQKQQQLSAQLLAAETALARLSENQGDHEVTLTAALELAGHCGRAYSVSSEAGRRDYNHAWFERLLVDVDDDLTGPTVADVVRAPAIAALQGHRPGGIPGAVHAQQNRRRDGGPAAFAVSVVPTMNF